MSFFPIGHPTLTPLYLHFTPFYDFLGSRAVSGHRTREVGTPSRSVVLFPYRLVVDRYIPRPLHPLFTICLYYLWSDIGPYYLVQHRRLTRTQVSDCVFFWVLERQSTLPNVSSCNVNNGVSRQAFFFVIEVLPCSGYPHAVNGAKFIMTFLFGGL